MAASSAFFSSFLISDLSFTYGVFYVLGVLIFWPPPKLALLLVTPGLLSDAFVSLFSD